MIGVKIAPLTTMNNDVIIQTLLLSVSYLTPQLSFTSRKACIVNLNNIFYSLIHTHVILSYTH